MVQSSAEAELETNADAIANQLAWAARELARNSPTPELDAEVLLCHCLGQSRSYLRAWPERKPDRKQLAQYHALIERRGRGEPVAYLTGLREFWSREFQVTPSVLIPRPDSELLIELSLSLLDPEQTTHILDLGAGSGILAITLALELPQAKVLAVDLNPAALDIARANAERLAAAGNLSLLASDWFNQIPARKFDLILSNPPYIAENDPHLQQGDLRFEPRPALVSAENGLADIRNIITQAKDFLAPGAPLLIEHGYNQAAAVAQLFAAHGYQHIQTRRDLSGQARVTLGTWN